jgi:hypothetical protein
VNRSLNVWMFGVGGENTTWSGSWRWINWLVVFENEKWMKGKKKGGLYIPLRRENIYFI